MKKIISGLLFPGFLLHDAVEGELDVNRPAEAQNSYYYQYYEAGEPYNSLYGGIKNLRVKVQNKDQYYGRFRIGSSLPFVTRLYKDQISGYCFFDGELVQLGECYFKSKHIKTGYGNSPGDLTPTTGAFLNITDGSVSCPLNNI